MKNKKCAAIMAAVQLFIKTREEVAIAAMQNQAGDAGARDAGSPPINLWGISGRQTIMDANAMIRQRVLK